MVQPGNTKASRALDQGSNPCDPTRSMVTIRIAQQADAKDILPLIQAYFSYTKIDEKELLHRINSDQFIYHCAQQNNQIAGFAEWEIIDDAEKIIRLNGIAVRPEFRERGIARALMEEGEHAAREKGMKKLTLLVSETNHAAQKVYAESQWNYSRKHLKKINGESAEVWEKNISLIEHTRLKK